MTGHPLDRPIWHALNGRQRHFARGAGLALRFDPGVEPFVACGEDTPEALAAMASLLEGPDDVLLYLQRAPAPIPPGCRRVDGGRGVQMVAERLSSAPRPNGIVPLGSDDGPAMLDLARRTKPGPFRRRTHELGGFWGVKDETGKLLAMAGERLKVAGMSEVSGVCTDPSARGRGYGAILSLHVASEIVRRGETPFLHAYADNVTAIRLYERLGFTLRCEVEALAFGLEPS